MSEDSGEKSHEATPHRRQKAREEGQVVKSQDLSSAALLVGGLLILWWLGEAIIDFHGRLAQDVFGGEAWLAIDQQTTIHQITRISLDLSQTMLPLLGLFFLAGVAVHLGQTGFLFVPEKLGFDLQRINPLQNYKRIFSLTSVVHLALGLLKIMLIATVAAWSLWGERGRLMNLADLSTAEIGQYLFHVTLWTSLKIGCSLLLLALFDYGYQYWKHEQDLRMSTQEMREEMKSQQGDPQVAQRRKAVQRQLMLNRLGSSVPTADVVITNPTELAIALKYDSETMAAPVVIAKGAGVLAQRIRRLALESNVPIVERKELARALYKNVDLNQPVPSEQYAAVAEVVRYVYQLQGKSLPGRR
jgi:flagellar biosynthetic protein FlhB